MTAWQPSHRRSEENGEIQDRWREDTHVVPVVMPETHGEQDPGASELALQLATALAQELLRGVLDLIAEGPKKTLPARLAAFRKHFKHDDRSYPVIARELEMSAGNFHRLAKELPAKLKGRSEVKRAKN